MSPYTSTYVLPILERAITERNDTRGIGGAKKVADELGVNPGLISWLRRGDYPNQEQLWYPIIVERYGHETVECKSLGTIDLLRCREEREKPVAAPSADYVRQRRACAHCPHNQGGGK